MWFVAQTHPNAEAKAQFNLESQGFEVYVPRIEKRRRHARKVETVRAPLFPGYIFISAGGGLARWRSIGGTFGVSRLVIFGAEPARLETLIVDTIRAWEDGGVVRLPRSQFNPGESVRVKSGAFADCIGLIDGMQDRERVHILLDLLGRKVRVTVDELSLERV